MAGSTPSSQAMYLEEGPMSVCQFDVSLLQGTLRCRIETPDGAVAAERTSP